MWPDLAFDPADGSPAGDTVSKSFSVDTGTSSGLSAQARYQAPAGDGYSVLDVDTSGFDPGDTLRFSIDIDPTSIRGVSGNPTPDAGGIGGAELSGATLTVRFSNGGQRTTDISLKPGSDTDGRATASAARPPEPGLARLSGASPAAVSSASQTVVVSGPAGASGVVVVAEGQLNVENVPGGGYDLDPYEANTAVRLDEVPFTIGAGGTVNVPITLHATPDADAREVGLNYVTAHLVSGGVPGPVSDPVILKLGDAPEEPPPPPPADGAVTFDGGLAVVEAEDADAKLARSGHDWLAGQGPAGSVAGALKVAPDTGLGASGDVAATSPQLSYRVDFPAPGTYHLWLRASGPDGAGNSVHTGLDGVLGPSYLNLYDYGPWTWVGKLYSGARATLSVPSAGVHTVNVWMREDGFSLDRLVIAASSAYTPAAGGPPATARAGEGEGDPGPAPDTTPPSLTGRAPAPGASDVAPGANVVATFSEPMDPASLAGGAFSLAPSAGGPAVAATVTTSAGNTVLTLDPAADLAPGTAYTATITAGARDAAGNALASAQSWSFTTAPAAEPPPSGDGAVTFVSGQAVVEAEDHDASIARGAKSWVSGQSPAGSAGAAMKALPDTGARITSSIATTSPELAYRVSFPAPGTYQLWLRMYGISNGNTLHAGIDGAATAQNVAVPTNAWRWVKTGVSVPSAGEHTLNVWMREDGISLDRFLLTTSTSFSPSGEGPAATPRA